MKKLTMLSSTIFLCTGLAFASLAQAHEGAYTRDEVKAELAQAQASGAMANSEDSSQFLKQYQVEGPAKTRHQVRDELEIAKMDGSFALINSDDSMARTRAHEHDAGMTRAEVRAELMQAKDSGELARINSDDSMARERQGAHEIMAE